MTDSGISGEVDDHENDGSMASGVNLRNSTTHQYKEHNLIIDNEMGRPPIVPWQIDGDGVNTGKPMILYAKKKKKKKHKDRLGIGDHNHVTTPTDSGTENEPTSYKSPQRSAHKLKIIGDDVVAIPVSSSKKKLHLLYENRDDLGFGHNSIDSGVRDTISAQSKEDFPPGLLDLDRLVERDIESPRSTPISIAQMASSDAETGDIKIQTGVETEMKTQKEIKVQPDVDVVEEDQKPAPVLTYDRHTFQEKVFWQNYCRIEKLKNHYSRNNHGKVSVREKFASLTQKTNATSFMSVAGVFALFYNVLFHDAVEPDEEDQVQRSRTRIVFGKIQTGLLKWKQRLEANRESYNISHEDAYAYWEFRMSHSYKPALLILIVDILVFFIIVPIFHNYFFSSTHQDTDDSPDADRYELVHQNFIFSSLINRIHFALLAQNFIWLAPVSLFLVYFTLYATAPSVKSLESSLQVNMCDMLQYLCYGILLIRMCVLSSHILHYLCSAEHHACVGGDESMTSFLSFELPIISVLHDYCQILVFSLLPLSRIFMFRLWLIEGILASLRIITCMGDGINVYNHLPLAFIVYSTVGGLINAGLLPVIGIERYMMGLFRNMQDQKNASMEKMKLVNMLCNDIKIPTQQLARTYRSFKSVLYKPKSINMEKNIQDMEQYVSLLNEVIDDLLFLVKVEENRFTFEAKDAIEVVDIATLAMAHLGRVFKLPEIICDNVKVEFISSTTIVPRSKVPNIKNVLTNKQCLKTILYYSYFALFCMMLNNDLKKFHHVAMNAGETIVSVLVSYELSTVEHELYNMLKFQIILNPEIFERFRRIKCHNAEENKSLFESSCLICTKLAVSCPGGQAWTISKEGVVEFGCMFKGVEVVDTEDDAHSIKEVDSGSNSDQELETSAKRIVAPIEDSMVRPFDSLDGDAPQSVSEDGAKIAESKDNYSESSDGTINSLNNIKAKKWLKSFVPQNVFAYVTNKGFESIFVDIVQRFPSGKHVTIVNTEPNTAMLAAFQVAVVQSVTVCERLRALQFRGLIVLVSERLTYLDASEQANFDFGLPIPCDKHDLHMFKLWLLKLRRQFQHSQSNSEQVGLEYFQSPRYTERWRRLSVSSSQSMFTPRVIRFPQNKVHIDEGHDSQLNTSELAVFEKRVKPTSVKTKFQWTIADVSRISTRLFLFGQLPINSHSMNNFFRWKFLNPANSHLHHSVPIDVALSSAVTYMLFGYLLGGYRWPFMLVGMLIYIIIYLVRFIAQTVAGRINPQNKKQENRGLHFWKFWSPMVFVEVIMVIIFTTCVFWTPWQNSRTGNFVEDMRHSNLTFGQFLNHQHGLMHGHEMMWTTITTPFTMRVLAEYLAWPWSLIVGLGKFAQTSVFFYLFIGVYLSPSMFLFIYYCFCFISVVIWANLYWREVVTRRGFRSLYEVIMMKEFRDRLAFLTQVSIAQILEDIHSLQQDVMRGVNQGCLEKEVLITDRLFQHIQAMHVHGMISKEMLTHLQVSDTRFFSLPRQVFVTNMKAMLIKDVLTKICSRFVAMEHPGSYSASFTINELATTTIYVNVAQSLTLVRVDEEVFTAILVQALATTLKHIQQRILEDRVRSNNANRDDANEIVIWLHPWLGQTGNNVKFTDVRTMVLTMVDTGTLSAVNELSNQNIPKTLSTLLDSCGDGFNGSRSLENRSIADQYSKYFDLPIGYSCGQIIPHTMDATMLYNSKMIVASPMLSRYTSYQQMGIPYLLCSDSHKISEFMDCQFRKQQEQLNSNTSQLGQNEKPPITSFVASIFSKGGGSLNGSGHGTSQPSSQRTRFKWHEVVAVEARNVLLYKVYHYGFGYILDQLNASVSERKFKDKLRLAVNNTRHLWKTSFSSVTIFTFHGNRDILKLRESRYQESFKNLGWHQCNIMVLKDLPSESRFLDLECLIIDADLKLTLPSTTLSCDALDLAHYLRGKGYLGVIVFAHRNAIFPSSSNNHSQTIAPNDSLRITGSSDSHSSSIRFLTRNPYNHGVSIDHHVSMPFSAEDAKVITHLCEERRVRLLLNLQ